MPKVDLEAIEETNRTGYPAPFDREVAGRWQKRLGPAYGLAALGATRVRLDPGAWSSHRHWLDSEDEMLVMIAGEAVLVEDDGRSLMRPGDIAVWQGWFGDITRPLYPQAQGLPMDRANDFQGH